MSKQLLGYQIAGFYLDLHHKTLSRDGRPIDVNERAFRLLQLLSEASPEPVSKQSLSSLLWQDTVVSEWSLFRLISDTRQLLGDNGEQQQLIKTARGIGFFIIQVQPCYDEGIEAKSLFVDRQQSWFRAVLSVLTLLVLWIGWFIYWPSYQQQKLITAITRISHYQDNTYTTFKAQLARRNELGQMIASRLQVKREQQWEKFFSLYYPQMSEQELFVFQQIRAMTETGLYQNNQAILNELESNPDIYQLIEGTKALQQHLRFWLNKYHSVFVQREDMGLLYVGVEDGVPYPSEVDQKVKDWLSQRHQQLPKKRQE